jgi:membrane dipeptidase
VPYIIDAHQDLAYNILTFGRDYSLSASETRKREEHTENIQHNGYTLLGWPDYQAGQVAMIFSTLFIAPEAHKSGEWETQWYDTPSKAYKLHRKQLDVYHRLSDTHPDQFQLVTNRQTLAKCLAEWEKSPAEYPTLTHPVGLVPLMEGAEGLLNLENLEEFWESGLRILGPVWAGGRFCGGTFDPGGFTGEGRELLETLADLGYILDISHMNEDSALEALDRYEGTIIASHANARALLRGASNERHFSDKVIARLVERGGVMGVLPYNKFLKIDWQTGDDRRQVTLDTLAAHIDHICQIAGSVNHVAIGTDFDGGFGWPDVPQEVNTIADLQKLEPVLKARGFQSNEISAVFEGNWHKILERALPEV